MKGQINSLIIFVVVCSFSNARGQGDSVRANAYCELDKYARETPDNVSRSTVQLAEYLQKKATSDTTKARLIFTWIATHVNYDDKAYNTGKYPEQTARKVLKRKAAVCAGFSALFDELAALMGLKSEKVSGYAKGYGYVSGQKLVKANHDWNAIKINGEWMLVDATWGRGFSERTGRGLESFNQFDDYWFLTPPDEFRFSHLPLDKEWQLVKPKINLDDFNKFPRVSKSEFKMGLKADNIFKSALDGSLPRLVTVYETPFPIKVVEIPYQKTLIAGTAYKFKFDSRVVKYIKFVEIGGWVPVEKEDNIFTTVIIPQGKALHVAVAIDPKYGGSTLLLYDVEEKK